MRKMTYKKSGVDITKANSFKKEIAPLLKKSFSADVLKGIGGFGSFFKFHARRYKEPVLVSSADGVGTKLKIASLAGRHDTIGIDAVAMNVNDILCCAAQPLFFLDYIAFSILSNSILKDVISGINNGCMEAGCSLIGGETAQMPGMYKTGDYDIAGFCVGVVEGRDIIDGSKIESGDIIIGLESSGLHSNGYSLARKVFSEKELKRMSAELLKPTRIYVKPVLSLLRTAHGARRTAITGIAHITGGAFYDKIARILPAGVNARIYRSSWGVPKIFRLIQNKGGIADEEMYHTFNMGIGMVMMIRFEQKDAVVSHLKQMGIRSFIIGEITKGKKEVEII